MRSGLPYRMSIYWARSFRAFPIYFAGRDFYKNNPTQTTSRVSTSQYLNSGPFAVGGVWPKYTSFGYRELDGGKVTPDCADLRPRFVTTLLQKTLDGNENRPEDLNRMTVTRYDGKTSKHVAQLLVFL